MFKLPELPGLEGLERLPGLSRLAGSARRKPRLRSLRTQAVGREDEQVALWARALGGDRELAERCAALKGLYPAGTLPEFVCMDWLERRREWFLYQAELFGGRRRAGGNVPDFVIIRGGQGLVWQIQGNYWHNRAEVKQRDLVDRQRFVGRVIGGARIARVVWLWERDLVGVTRERRNAVLWAALSGREMR